MTAVSATRVTKRYGPRIAVDDVSFSVDAGEIFALVGPNGAGKTTTVEIAAGLRHADEGDVTVLDMRPGSRRVASRIGVMPQQGDLYAGIHVEEALRLFASFYDEPDDVDVLVRQLDLDRVRTTAYRRLSGGERRRLSLAIALVGRPLVAFLDEPTAEVDVEGRAATWQLVSDLKARGAAVVLTTHQLDEAERVADRIAIMRLGRIAASGSPADLASTDAPELRFSVGSAIDADELSRSLGAHVVAVDAQHYRVPGREPTPALAADVTAWLAGRGVMLRSLEVGTRSLAEVYRELTR